MPIKKWFLPKIDNEVVDILVRECQDGGLNINSLNASVLVSRGHSNFVQAEKFLSQDDSLANPFDIKDMDIAVNRINQAIENEEKIAVYGDYDCDGITSTAILYTYFNSIGADVIYFIPSRDDGYGLNKQSLQDLFDQGVKLVITVDNGISAIEEVEFANSLGLEVIITDHHQPSNVLPPAIAIVNPHQKDDTSSFKYLAGCGVAFKLIASLEDGDYTMVLEQFSDIVAIGTIGDIVALENENRAIVRYGLENLRNSDNLGLNALIEVSKTKLEEIDSIKVAFRIVPRINAAGRIGDPLDGVKLLISEDEDEALELAQNLDALNNKRKQMQEDIIQEVESFIKLNPEVLARRVLILKGEDWHHGIIGIVCSNLLEKYGKPTLVMSAHEDCLRGSARSIGEFHLFKALSYCSEHLDRFGGHKLAAGFSVIADQFDLFVDKMEEYALINHQEMPGISINVDVTLSGVPSLDDVTMLSNLEPFGCANEVPVFCLKNCSIQNITPSKDGKHQKLHLILRDGSKCSPMLFSTTSEQLIFKNGDVVDIIAKLGINEYMSRVSVDVKIDDIRLSSFNERKFFSCVGYYDKITRREFLSNDILKHVIPKRELIKKMYLFLRKNNGSTLHVDDLYMNMYVDFDKARINYCKYRVILTILQEANLINISPSLIGIEFIPINNNDKVNLEDTPIMSYLKSEYSK